MASGGGWIFAADAVDEVLGPGGRRSHVGPWDRRGTGRCRATDLHAVPWRRGHEGHREAKRAPHDSQRKTHTRRSLPTGARADRRGPGFSRHANRPVKTASRTNRIAGRNDTPGGGPRFALSKMRSPRVLRCIRVPIGAELRHACRVAWL